MTKSSIDYAELSGLKHTLYFATASGASENIVTWLKERIDYLSKK